MRAPQSRTFWEGETKFCEMPGTPENVPQFRLYCRMQSNFCWKDGYRDLAQRIANTANLTIDEVNHARWLTSLK